MKNCIYDKRTCWKYLNKITPHGEWLDDGWMDGWMNGYSTIPHIITLTVAVCDGHYLFQFLESTRRLTGSTSRTMSAMSLGFIVMVTPWTIQEVVAACTGSKVFILCPVILNLSPQHWQQLIAPIYQARLKFIVLI